MRSFHAVGGTVNIAVSSSSQAVALGQVDQVRVMNDGSATAWIAFGNSAIAAATATGIPIGAGVTEVWSIPAVAGANTYAAVIAGGSTGKIYFTPGSGI